MHVKLAKSLRKYLRTEKNRIRRQALNLADEKKMIWEIYEKLGLKRQFSNLKKADWPKEGTEK
jgi:hypothetical protein